MTTIDTDPANPTVVATIVSESYVLDVTHRDATEWSAERWTVGLVWRIPGKDAFRSSSMGEWPNEGAAIRAMERLHDFAMHAIACEEE